MYCTTQEDMRGEIFDPENPFFDEKRLEAMPTLLQLESDYMVAEGYSKNNDILSIRNEAIRMIKHYALSSFLESVIPFLAVNYFDRFVSRKPIPTLLEGQQENLQLFTTCCFSIAWRMRSLEFFPSDFLMEQELNFDIDQLKEMEYLILTGLEWRTRSVTALAFLDFFLGFFDEQLNENHKVDLKYYAKEKIYRNQYDIRYTEFKPSIIAASALLFCFSFDLGANLSEFKTAVNAIRSCEYVDPESIHKCLPRSMDKEKLEAILLPNLVVSQDNELVEGSSPKTPKSVSPSAALDNTTTSAAAADHPTILESVEEPKDVTDDDQSRLIDENMMKVTPTPPRRTLPSPRPSPSPQMNKAVKKSLEILLAEQGQENEEVKADQMKVDYEVKPTPPRRVLPSPRASPQMNKAVKSSFETQLAEQGQENEDTKADQMKVDYEVIPTPPRRILPSPRASPQMNKTVKSSFETQLAEQGQENEDTKADQMKVDYEVIPTPPRRILPSPRASPSLQMSKAVKKSLETQLAEQGQGNEEMKVDYEVIPTPPRRILPSPRASPLLQMNKVVKKSLETQLAEQGQENEEMKADYEVIPTPPRRILPSPRASPSLQMNKAVKKSLETQLAEQGQENEEMKADYEVIPTPPRRILPSPRASPSLQMNKAVKKSFETQLAEQGQENEEMKTDYEVIPMPPRRILPSPRASPSLQMNKAVKKSLETQLAEQGQENEEMKADHEVIPTPPRRMLPSPRASPQMNRAVTKSLEIEIQLAEESQENEETKRDRETKADYKVTSTPPRRMLPSPRPSPSPQMNKAVKKSLEIEIQLAEEGQEKEEKKRDKEMKAGCEVAPTPPRRMLPSPRPSPQMNKAVKKSLEIQIAEQGQENEEMKRDKDES